MPQTAPARSASFAAMQDSKPPSSARMSRSASASKLSQMAKEGGSKSKNRKYDADSDLRTDIETCRQALELFLASRMRESETLLKESDPKMERLYIVSGHGLIQSVKAFMSFEDKVRFPISFYIVVLLAHNSILFAFYRISPRRLSLPSLPQR
jgi:hypothetical protein